MLDIKRQLVEVKNIYERDCRKNQLKECVSNEKTALRKNSQREEEKGKKAPHKIYIYFKNLTGEGQREQKWK